jgi:hypothetical protein
MTTNRDIQKMKLNKTEHASERRKVSHQTNSLAESDSTLQHKQKPRLVSITLKELHLFPAMHTLVDLKRISLLLMTDMVTLRTQPRISFAGLESLPVMTWRT